MYKKVGRPLRILIELGIIGLAIYLSLLLSLFIFTVKETKKTENIYLKNYLFSVILIFAATLTFSTGDNILRTMPLQYLIWGYTGVVIALINKEKEILQ
jgi:O-antigen ligase